MAHDYISNRFPLIAHEVERDGKTQSVWFHGTRYAITRLENGHIEAVRGKGEPEPSGDTRPAYHSPEWVRQMHRRLAGRDDG